MIDGITGIILAGGKSSRMGEDKAFTMLFGRPLIEIIIAKLTRLFDNLIIITNKPRLYKKYGIKTQSDIVKDCGPLGGVYTGLISSGDKYNFIVGCDMPFLNEDLIKFMSKKTKSYDVIIPERNGQLEPLCAIYSKTCIKPIMDKLSRKNLKITDFLKNVKVKKITEEEVSRFDEKEIAFININRPRDKEEVLYERIKN